LQVRILRAAFFFAQAPDSVSAHQGSDALPTAIPPKVRSWGAWVFTVSLCMMHGWAVWIGMGRLEGMSNGWPLAQHDHPEHFHNAAITPAMWAASRTTSGYDPSFMAGYAKSILSDSSSTFSDLAVGLLGSSRPVLGYKIYVLLGTAAAPWFVAAACRVWRAPPGAVALAVGLFLVYIWTDYPLNYPEYGMVAYFVSVPLGLLVTSALTVYIERGGVWRWVGSAFGSAALVLVHVTSPMIVLPAAAVAYLAAVVAARGEGARLPVRRHLGVWAVPGVVLAANAFWWLPGVWLASTKGQSDLAFAHPEGVLRRLAQIVTVEAPVECVLIAGALVGLPGLLKTGRVRAAGLSAFLGAGFFWGYLAGASRTLDALQPGRHTYAFYTAAAVAAGFGWSDLAARLRNAGPNRLDAWLAVGLLVVGVRLFLPSMVVTVQSRLDGAEPFLSSHPTPRLRWVVDRVGRHVRRGERLLYEEGGLTPPGQSDVFAGGRYSGLLPYLTGVEVLGGPFLHVTLASNFTQFGEGKLFGKDRWRRAHFLRYARLYRPSAIVCWSPHARAFCLTNPDLVEVKDNDGFMLIGRVVGFPGAAVEGSAEVEASPGRLRVSRAEGGLDGSVVLRYHSVPCLRADPPVAWEPVYLEGDPVPFIKLRPPLGPVTFGLSFPPDAKPSAPGPAR